MKDSFPWSVLDIPATRDARAIRSAYAARVKAMDLDADVEGYALLRRARDTALREARTMAPEMAAAEPGIDLPAAEPEPLEQGAPALPRWFHAAPALAGEWLAEAALSTRLPDPDDTLIPRLTPDLSSPAHDAPLRPLAPGGVDPLAAPLLEGHAQTTAVDTRALQSPFARLAALLDVTTPTGSQPLTDAEEAGALPLLDAVLDAIHWSEIGRQTEMETWLAGLLADAWPRSAPLLERATTALGWEQEWGKLDARPTMEYLGARLRGYRFQRKAMRKGHRYHRAWNELVRPGRAGPLRFLRAGSTDVRGLLAGVRKHFPELEEHFDAERVASWEKSAGWTTGLIVIGGMIILGALLSLSDPRGKQEAFEATVTEVFGAGHDPKWLSRHQPGLASRLADDVQSKSDGSVDVKATIESGLEMVRARVYLDGRNLTGEDFETTMRLRLALLEAAQAQGPDACRRMMGLAAPPPSTPVPPEVRERERRFAAGLVERGLLGTPEKAPASSASVPAEIVDKVVKATGLTGEEVSAAMGNGADDNRCKAMVALLRATLDWEDTGLDHAEQRRTILRTL